MMSGGSDWEVSGYFYSLFDRFREGLALNNL